MKHKIKLLKDWTDPSGNEFKAGQIIELDDDEIASKLLLDEIGIKTRHEDRKPEDVKKIVTDAVKEGIDSLKRDIKDKKIDFTHDKSDDDPTHGFLPPKEKYTVTEMKYGMGLFFKEVYAASLPGGHLPERLSKSRDRVEKMLEKAAGDGMTVGTDSEGGFMVPPAFSLMLLDGSLEIAVVRPRVTSLEMTSDRIELPQVKNYDHSSNQVYGGIQVYWKAENALLTESKPAMEEIAFNLQPLTALAYASHKMMRFSPIAVGSFLLPKMSEAMAWKEDDGFINGTGAGMPLGLLNAPGKVEQAIENGQTLAGSAFVSQNAVKMFARLRVEKNASTVWLYNKPELFRWLALLSIDVGTAGSAAGLVTRIPGSPSMDMLGYQLVDTEHTKAVGTAGDIILADLSQYIVADDRKGPEIAQSMHLKFDYGQEAFRIIKYVDGGPRWTAAFTRQNGAVTVSPIVTLGARS